MSKKKLGGRARGQGAHAVLEFGLGCINRVGCALQCDRPSGVPVGIHPFGTRKPRPPESLVRQAFGQAGGHREHLLVLATTRRPAKSKCDRRIDPKHEACEVSRSILVLWVVW